MRSGPQPVTVGFPEKPCPGSDGRTRWNASSAVPPCAVIRLLETLVADAHNVVAIASGRPAKDLDRWFGRINGIWLFGEHGAEARDPQTGLWEALRPEASLEWKATVLPILEHFVDRTPGSFVEEKKYSVVWHYRMAEPEFGAWLANELVSMLEAMLAETELRAVRGEKIVEIKPVWANKGEALERLLVARPSPDFLFAAGNDRTDEDLFERASSTTGWTVHIGPGPTRASFVVPDVEAILAVLAVLPTSSHPITV